MEKDAENQGRLCPVHSDSRNAWLELQAPQDAPLHISTNKDSRDICKEPSTGILYKIIPKLVDHNLKYLWDSATTWPAPPQERAELNSRNPVQGPIASLGSHREVSTIPRAQIPRVREEQHTNQPANCERESGVSPEGNWIYPSEKMFFDAIHRKGYSSEVKDMKIIVPIHNAVNERAWKEIKKWEEPWISGKCGGPKLHSFEGKPSCLTPKARLNTWLGYMAPFDRHDWIVDRCGKKVEYVIDFYVGKAEGNEKKNVNFFLDVRPKLNTWEGWKMRTAKGVGLV